MDCKDGGALAGVAGTLRVMELGLSKTYNLWSKAGVWERLFQALSDDPDFEYVMIDSTIVRAHQHSAGAKGGLRRRKPLVAPKAD